MGYSTNDRHQWSYKAKLDDDVSEMCIISQVRQQEVIYSRKSQSNQQCREIQRIEKNRHRFVPPKHNEYSIHPIRNLAHTRHRTPLCLNVVRVGVFPEFICEIEHLCLREDNEAGLKIEFFAVAIEGL